MKSKSLIAALLAALSLTSCDLLGDKKEDKKEEEQHQDDPSADTEKTLSSGSTLELDGNFALSSGEKEGVVALVYNASTSKTKVYGIRGGTVKVSNGSKAINITVKYDVTGALVGKDYASRQYVSSDNKGIAIDYLKVNGDPANIEDYKVGNKNPFFMDVDVQFKSFVLDDGQWFEDDNFVNLAKCGNFFLDGKKPRIEVAGQDYLTLNDDLSVSFKDAAKDQKFELSFVYSLNGSDKTVKEYVTVKEGYNAHDDAELRKYFEDAAIDGEVFLTRSIKASLPESRYITYVEDGVTHKIPSNTQDVYSGKKGSPYLRASDATDMGKVRINGNYFEISAETIEDHVPLEETKQSALGIYPMQGQPIDPLKRIANPFEGVFSIYTPNANKVTAEFANLKITSNGNRALPGQDTPSDGANSLVNIFGRDGHFALDNVKLNRGYAGVYSVGKSAVTMDYVDIYDNWGPGTHSFRGNAINVTHSHIHANGGPAIWVLNNGGDESFKTQINCGEGVVIDNFVSPTGSWLTANSVSVDDLVNLVDPILNAGGATMLKDGNLNFEILIQNEFDLGSDNHLAKYVTYDGCSNSEQPSRFDGNYLQTPVGQIFSQYNAFFTSFGMTDSQINDAIIADVEAYCYEHSILDPSTIPADVMLGLVQNAWATAVGTDMKTRMMTGKAAHLDLTTSIEQGGNTYEIAAILGVLPLTK